LPPRPAAKYQPHRVLSASTSRRPRPSSASAAGSAISGGSRLASQVRTSTCRPAPRQVRRRAQGTTAGATSRPCRPEDDFESDHVSWIPLADIPAPSAKAKSPPAPPSAALLYALTRQLPGN
jgi:hypothetical protein